MLPHKKSFKADSVVRHHLNRVYTNTAILLKLRDPRLDTALKLIQIYKFRFVICFDIERIDESKEPMYGM